MNRRSDVGQWLLRAVLHTAVEYMAQKVNPPLLLTAQEKAEIDAERAILHRFEVAG